VPWSQIGIVPCVSDCAVSTGIMPCPPEPGCTTIIRGALPTWTGGGHCATGSLHDGDVLRALMCNVGGALDYTAGEPMGGFVPTRMVWLTV
jgi:hypothetical protein